ncbi:MAG: gliding motility-associated ABC transporter substrate-binding protein GldG [Bergeyella sp.]|nr:gliding motility-associated ABC transporter substrate-binding protein GldG [Bergeyella sp.]
MNNKFLNITFVVLLIICFLGSLGVFKFRLDLTEEKKYTLSSSSIQILKKVQKPLLFEVYLDGDFPAAFRQLQEETRFILQEFRNINPLIDYKFIDPIEKRIPRDTLEMMGLKPSLLSNVKEGRISELVLFPYAVLKTRSQGLSVPLVVEKFGISSGDQITRSIEELEYQLISSINNLVTKGKKRVGILVNQDELGPRELHGFLSMASENYKIGALIPKNSRTLTQEDFPMLEKQDVLVIAKPRKPFTDNEKLILDQYIMNGGRSLWMVDAVRAEIDSLFSSKKMMAYPIDLNLNDLFFSYGVRIQSALVKDLKKAAFIRLVTGEVAGNPQYTSFLWPYFPIGISEKEHPITKNINPVKFEFPTSIDTLYRKGIRKEVLFESSTKTIIKKVPNLISLSEIMRTDSLSEREVPSSPKIFAVCMEGRFTSAYASRSEKNEFPKFRSATVAPNKMIVVSDGDIARNAIVKGNPLPLGYDVLTDTNYGNEQFLRNALDYLLDDNRLMNLRNRKIESRRLDLQRIERERGYWQWLNLLVPVFFIVFLGMFFIILRKREYGN